MFQVNGNPIVAEELDVLLELRRQLLLNGHELFRVFKPTGRNNIMTNCPFHKFGQERKPSFGISRSGECHCFGCGWAGPLENMISLVFGRDDNGDFGKQWLSKNFLVVAVEQRKPLNLSLARGQRRQEIQSPGFTEEELDSYRYYHDYMYERGLTDKIIQEFDVGYDYKTECLTFPCYYDDGTPAFVARRSVKTKFFNYPEEVLKPVYGAEIINRGGISEVIICESILNCLTCWKYDRPAVALIGTGTEYQYNVLRKLPVRKYIIATDPDDAGRRAADKLKFELSGSKIITFLELPEGLDINDLQEKFLDVLEYF